MSVAQASGDLDVHETVLRKWMRDATGESPMPLAGPGDGAFSLTVLDHVPARMGRVGAVLATLAVLVVIHRLRVALRRNQRYRFTTLWVRPRRRHQLGIDTVERDTDLADVLEQILNLQLHRQHRQEGAGRHSRPAPKARCRTFELTVMRMYLNMLQKVVRPATTPSCTSRLFFGRMMSAAFLAMSTAESTETPRESVFGRRQHSCGSAPASAPTPVADRTAVVGRARAAAGSGDPGWRRWRQWLLGVLASRKPRTLIPAQAIRG